MAVKEEIFQEAFQIYDEASKCSLCCASKDGTASKQDGIAAVDRAIVVSDRACISRHGADERHARGRVHEDCFELP